MTLPAEIRHRVWRYVIPELIELDEYGPQYIVTSEKPRVRKIYHGARQLPPNPCLPIRLVSKQCKTEINRIPNPILQLRAKSMYSEVQQWLQDSVLQVRKLISQVRMDRERLYVFPEKSSTVDRVLNHKGDFLLHWYRHVRLVGYQLDESPSQGGLDVTFEVGDARDKRVHHIYGTFAKIQEQHEK